MKKFSGLCILLAVVFLLQMFSFPVYAAETGENTETTAAMEAPLDPVYAAPEAEYGTATILSGCRTIEAQSPLGGSSRILDTANSAFVYELNTGTLIYAYNPDLSVSPGGLSRVMTALVAIEHGNLDDVVTVREGLKKDLPNGSNTLKLTSGEKLTLRDLLYGMFLGWNTDCALLLAEHIAGSQANYVQLMNECAQRIGCVATVFGNIHGLDNTSQTTTARDMAKITQYALKNPTFKELFGAVSYKIEATEFSEARTLKALNYLKEETWVPKYNDDRVTGGFASYSDAAGANLTFSAEAKGMSYIMVLLGCSRQIAENGYTVLSYGNYEEAWDLLAFAFDNYKICRLLYDGQSMSQFTVANGENQVVGQSHASMDAVLPIDANMKNLIYKYSVANGGLTAPIVHEQKIANLQIWYRTSCIAETEIYAMSSVSEVSDTGLKIQSAIRTDSDTKGVLRFVGIVCLLILGPVVIYLVVNRIRWTIARNRRRRRRQERRRSR